MKPHRIHVTHELVTAYDMQEKMQVLVSGLRGSEVVDLQTDLICVFRSRNVLVLKQ
jgi:hypothetical protein